MTDNTEFERDVWANILRLDNRIDNLFVVSDIDTKKHHEHYEHSIALAGRIAALEGDPATVSSPEGGDTQTCECLKTQREHYPYCENAPLTDPALDPIGTVRRFANSVFVKLAEPADEPWHIAYMWARPYMSGWQSNEDLAESPVVGYVPFVECGTPDLPVAPNLGAGDSEAPELATLSPEVRRLVHAVDRMRDSWNNPDGKWTNDELWRHLHGCNEAVWGRNDPAGSIGGDSTAGRWYNESRWFDDYRAAESGTVAEVTDRLVAASSEWDDETGDAETARPYLEHLAQAVESWLNQLFGKWRAPTDSPDRFTCPGLSMPQPADAPYEGYVACYIAGHKCISTVTRTEDAATVTTKGHCGCCGDLHYSMCEPVVSSSDGEVATPLADLPHEEWRGFHTAATGTDPGPAPAQSGEDTP